MKRCFTIIIILFSLFFTISSVFSISDETEISLDVTVVPPVCDNDGICEAGETEANCPLDCLPPAPIIPGVSDLTPPTVYNIFVKEITLNSAVIEWEVTEHALCQLFWGESREYEKGVISETNYTIEKHSTSLTDLSAALTYHFKIKCQDRSKNESETRDQKFTTLSPPDITPPANVSNFMAIAGDSLITLIWQNPHDLDFKALKIMRSANFYPRNPSDGIPVYDGRGTSFTDTGLQNGITYYYTAFVYDKSENYSSGATVSAIPFKIKPPPPPIIPPPPIVPPPPEIEKLTLEDFEFWQEGKKLEITKEGLIGANPEKPLITSIDYKKVPEVLKTIMVTLKKLAYIPEGTEKIEEEEYFSFLLRINKEKTAYTATILPPESGIYPLILSIFDYKNQVLKNISGQLQILELLPPEVSIPWRQKSRLIYVLVGFLILAATIYFFRKIKNQIAKPRETKTQNHAKS